MKCSLLLLKFNTKLLILTDLFKQALLMIVNIVYPLSSSSVDERRIQFCSNRDFKKTLCVIVIYYVSLLTGQKSYQHGNFFGTPEMHEFMFNSYMPLLNTKNKIKVLMLWPLLNEDSLCYVLTLILFHMGNILLLTIIWQEHCLQQNSNLIQTPTMLEDKTNVLNYI